MSGWKEYHIGNALRGPARIKARSAREAWERARKRRLFPRGIVVWLSVVEPVPVVLRCAAGIVDALPRTGTRTIACGISDEPWPKTVREP